MDNQLQDHENRIRAIEQAIIQLDIKLRELVFSQSANSTMLQNLAPKVQDMIDDDRLAKRVEKQLKASEVAGWTNRERYMAMFVGIATLGNLGLNALFLLIGRK